MGTWENRVVAITGASSGIGAETAWRLSRKGATVLLMARNGRKLNETASRLTGPYEVFELDVGSAERVEAVMREAIGRYGKIDVLINNAGYGRFERFLDMPLEDFENMMNVNYMGVVRCTKAVLPHMIAAGGGHIVNVASLAGKIGTAKSSGYSATKHAVLGLTNSLRQELAGTGVFVTAVNPGPVDTPFFDIADPSGRYVARLKRFILKPEQVAEAIIDAVERKRTDVDLPAAAGFAARMFHLMPRSLFDRLSRRLLDLK